MSEFDRPSAYFPRPEMPKGPEPKVVPPMTITPEELEGWKQFYAGNEQGIVLRMIAHIEQQAAEIRTLTAERDRLRGAMEWYANEYNWQDCGEVGGPSNVPTHKDQGERARNALAGRE